MSTPSTTNTPSTSAPSSASAGASPSVDAATEVDPAMDPVLGVDYRTAGDVRRMLNERANAVAYGDTLRVNKIERDLKGLGFTGDVDAHVGGGDKAPIGRSSGKPDVTSPVVTNPASPSTTSTTPSSSTSTAGTSTPGATGTSTGGTTGTSTTSAPTSVK